MKEFAESEKARLQALFEPFNEGRQWIPLIEPGWEPVRLGLVDGYTATRVAPHFDTGVEVKRVDFWLPFKAMGYEEG